MASNYPTSLDSFTDPLSTSPLNSPSHAGQHQDLNDAVEKIELKLGLGSTPISYTSATATTGYSANTPLLVISKAATIYAGRMYKISGYLGFQPSANALACGIYFTVTGGITKALWYRADQILANYPQYQGGSYIATATALGVTSGSVSKTFNLYFRSSATGSLNTNPDGNIASNGAEQLLWIEDIGPA